jgi:GGDEF domain-containing protein
MLAGPEGLVTETAIDGIRRIFGYVQLPGTQARIAVGFDEKEILTRVDREMWAAFTEVGFVTVLVLLGIWFGGERLLVRPIRALAATAGHIGRGEIKGRATELPWAAEFVPLAVALDDMAGQLSAREQELRDTNSQLRELAQVDALTGLANRRAFNERLAAEWKLAIRLRQPIAVLMIDVDHFKMFNDLYGHVQGDTCLRKVAGVLMAGTRAQAENSSQAIETAGVSPLRRIDGHSRKADFAARYGGEEFAVLLPGADLEAALQVAERLRHGVESLLIAHARSSWGFVSISIGAASISPAERGSPQDVTEWADAALYQAKHQGRNRVTGDAPLARARTA